MNDAFPSGAVDAADLAQWMRGHAAEQGFQLDASQAAVIGRFARVQAELLDAERREGVLARILARRRKVRGLYLWGGVGRGKSFLMDGFFSATSVSRKRRVHFHRFMQEIHHGMRDRQGQADPLLAVARDIAARVRLLCLDEFHITDITDAMLMRRLLEGLVGEGVVIVTTSNFAPDELYLHGLQRGQFLPTIELIKREFEVVNVDGGIDYRLRELEKAGIYHTEVDADDMLDEAFAHIAGDDRSEARVLEVEGRAIRARRETQGVGWFEFGELCDGPRGKPDYIELARRYHTILLSGVPVFTGGDADKLRRFVWLIDEFYDRRVKLLIAAAAEPDELIAADDGGDRFLANLNASLKERLVSRLTEMRTAAYLTQPHLP